MDIATFQELVWENYRTMDRWLPWRAPEADGQFAAYKILVSEVMLQQTQAGRVIPKYQQFIERFPDQHSLAQAPLADVLVAWSGLGYNRRARYLHEAAKRLGATPQPWSYDDLVACKGIGPNTAAAICVYAYNVPLVFIETNIRTVFIHHFFSGSAAVHDKELLPYISETLDREYPREWYWALMDYGVQLKSTVGNAARSSKHYAKQSKFEGSRRQVRGRVLRELASGVRTSAELAEVIPDERLAAVLQELRRDGLISVQGDQLSLG